MLSTLIAVTFLLAPTSVLFVATALAVVGSPPIGDSLAPRQIDTLCEQYEWVTAGDFSLGTDFWGEASASSGSQCVYLDWDNGGNAISWQTSYTWEGDGSSVKSYANAGLTMGAPQLSSISSLTTSWSWSYTGSGIGADVSYDAFISSTESTTAAHDYEVMIWLAALGGAEPLGCCTAIATPTIGGITWNLYKGYNTWTVYSFVATSEQTDFSGDAMDFFTYLIDYEGIPSYYYLQSIAGGTEAFLGEDVLFTVSPFSLSLST